MKTLVKILAGGGLLSLGLAYYFHNPIPNDVPNWFAAQAMTNVLKFAEKIGSILEFMGVKNRWKGYRFFLDVKMNVTYSDVETKQLNIGGVKCTLFVPDEFKQRNTPGPAVIYVHGGGWVFGSVMSNLELYFQIARTTGFVVLAPDYRLAPENPFPLPFQDCLNSAKDFIIRAADFNVDPNRIAIGGDSAGGNLAVSVALQLVKEGFNPAMILAITPILQMADFRLPSHQRFSINFFSKSTISKMWLSYIGLNHRMDLGDLLSANGHTKNKQIEIKEFVDPSMVIEEYNEDYNLNPIPLTPKQALLLDDSVLDQLEELMFNLNIAPLMASDDDLKKMPPTYIVINEYDPLRDEGTILYKRLKKLNRKTWFQIFRRSLHAGNTIGALMKNSYYAEQNAIFLNALKKELSTPN